MTTLTTASPRVLVPTTLDRVLLRLSRSLARAAQMRMESRAARQGRDAARSTARRDGRPPFAETEFYLRVR